MNMPASAGGHERNERLSRTDMAPAPMFALLAGDVARRHRG